MLAGQGSSGRADASAVSVAVAKSTATAIADAVAKASNSKPLTPLPEASNCQEITWRMSLMPLLLHTCWLTGVALTALPYVANKNASKRQELYTWRLVPQRFLTHEAPHSSTSRLCWLTCMHPAHLRPALVVTSIAVAVAVACCCVLPSLGNIPFVVTAVLCCI